MTPTPTMTGNALRRARDFLGFTQEEMAAKLDVSIATYQRREALAEEYVPRTEGAFVERMVELARTTEP